MHNCSIRQMHPYDFIQLAISFAIIAGNLLVIVTIVNSHKLHSTPYYFLCGLAMADGYVGLFLLINSLSPLFPLGELCNTFRCAMVKNEILMSIELSVALYVTVTIERYISILYPLKHAKWMSERNAVIIIIAIWICGILLNISMFALYMIEASDSASKVCLNPGQGLYSIIFSIVNLTLNPVAIMLISFCYYRIGRTAMRQFRAIDTEQNSTHSTLESSDLLRQKLKLAKVILLNLGIFVLSWLPLLVCNAIILTCSTWDECLLSSDAFNLASVPVFCNSMANVFVYAMKLQEFRRSVVKLFRK